MFRVAVVCANLFHEEVEGGGASTVITARAVGSRTELDDLLGRGVEIHARCYCGHVTAVTPTNAILIPEDEESSGSA